ncbi:hypothetical protein Cob_v002908 [Colletotrichum orbiculare MAFF 240422]|uniref:Aminoglycoside phosphotransferase domain-containing protein n=1 Tax=Colletotrichum orbiculare (strain 104-T / ATCC 96160 / CBS 514.97 / LARS 414 / MAFF 240422) TaxID=1213857 RepID=A0A484G1K8_COLOR|nr:hypothetical protein Cob_v002908 [Colletotrichum orbiculare MAFF 240422]
MAFCDNASARTEHEGERTGAESDDEEEKVAAFLKRCDLDPVALDRIHEFARSRTGCEVERAPVQGYCSYTLVIRGGRRWRDSGVEVGGLAAATEGIYDGNGDGEGTWGGRLVQFRPGRHGIDVDLCREARDVLGGGVVPHVEALGVVKGLERRGGGVGGEMEGFVVERVDGLSLTEFRRRELAGRRARGEVVSGLAKLFAASWGGRREVGGGDGRGRVGSSLRWRLGLMADELPREFGDVARGVMRAMDDIEGLPWVITHGDLVADNIMVESEGDGAGRLVGLIDWAEAEWLPFGVGLYGLEEVLGQDVGADDTDKTRFEYYPDAMELRAMFWVEVAKVVDDEDAIRTAKMAQVLGVLLWRGIAFDDGALSRVVNEEDWWDVQRLRTWLFDERGLGFTSERPAWWERTWRKLQGWVGWCLR